MRAIVIGAAAVLLGTAALAPAEGNDRYNGKYLVSGAKHTARADKSKSIATKRKVAPHFNPKKIAVDQSVPWQKAPQNSSRQMKSRSPHLLD